MGVSNYCVFPFVKVLFVGLFVVLICLGRLSFRITEEQLEFSCLFNSMFLGSC